MLRDNFLPSIWIKSKETVTFAKVAVSSGASVCRSYPSNWDVYFFKTQLFPFCS